MLCRTTGDRPEVLLGHMGGPYWARKDRGAWTIPKGEYEPDEEPPAKTKVGWGWFWLGALFGLGLGG